MKKKYSLLATISLFAVTALGITVFASQSNILKIKAGEISPGSIHISTFDNDITGSGAIKLYSARGNDLDFDRSNVTKSEYQDYFTFSDANGSYLKNVQALHGMYSISFDFPDDSTRQIKLETGHDGLSYDKTQYFSAYGEGFYYHIELNDSPAYFRLSTNGEDFTFYGMTIDYTCQDVELENANGININQNNFDGINLYNTGEGNYIFAETGTTLSNIDFHGIGMGLDVGDYVYLDSSGISDFHIAYQTEESTTVLEGENLASISYTYRNFDRGYNVTMSNVTILGYDHYVRECAATASVSRGAVEKQTSDALPELYFYPHFHIYLKDSSDNTIHTREGDIYDGILITNEMIVSLDTNPFTAYGKHSMVVTYDGTTIELDYVIFDMDHYNIQGVYSREPIEVEVGTSNADFLEMLEDIEFDVFYHRRDEEHPEKTPNVIHLTSSNLTNLVSDAFMTYGTGHVELAFDYLDYSGSFYVQLQIPAGNLIATYTCAGGIPISFEGNYDTLELYDNGTCIAYREDGVPSPAMYCERNGNLLTISYEYVGIIRVVLDDEHETFELYNSGATAIYEDFEADFSAFGVNPEFEATVTIYNDGTLTFIGNYFGTMTLFYEETSANVYSFTFVGFPSIGTLDVENEIMVVTLAS